jgi:hypothetical protein
MAPATVEFIVNPPAALDMVSEDGEPATFKYECHTLTACGVMLSVFMQNGSSYCPEDRAEMIPS